MAHDVLDDARYAHTSPSEDADDTIKTVSYIGTDEDWLAVVNPWNLEEGLLIETYLCNDGLLDERHSAGNSVKNVGTQIYDHDSDLCQGDKPNDR